MAWLVMSLRINQLKQSKNDHQYQLLQLQREIRQLTSFSNAIGDGQITPGEISSLGSDLFGDALDFMGYGNEAATEMAQTKTDYYSTAYDTITQEQYYNNPAIAAQATLYFDENGDLDTERMETEFYNEALKEYAEDYIKPLLKEKEDELTQKQTELETMIQLEEQELESLKESISGEIQQNAPKFS